MFARGSRYAPVPEGVFVAADGRERPFKLLRVIPEPVRGPGHRVTDVDRLDLIAHRYLGDPELFWLLCDANRALRPVDLLEPGARLVVPLVR